MKNVTRKVQGRPPCPLYDFILQKRPDAFVGFGVGAVGVPEVMAVEGKVR